MTNSMDWTRIQRKIDLIDHSNSPTSLLDKPPSMSVMTPVIINTTQHAGKESLLLKAIFDLGGIYDFEFTVANDLERTVTAQVMSSVSGDEIDALQKTAAVIGGSEIQELRLELPMGVGSPELNKFAAALSETPRVDHVQILRLPTPTVAVRTTIERSDADYEVLRAGILEFVEGWKTGYSSAVTDVLSFEYARTGYNAGLSCRTDP